MSVELHQAFGMKYQTLAVGNVRCRELISSAGGKVNGKVVLTGEQPLCNDWYMCMMSVMRMRLLCACACACACVCIRVHVHVCVYVFMCLGVCACVCHVYSEHVACMYMCVYVNMCVGVFMYVSAAMFPGVNSMQPCINIGYLEYWMKLKLPVTQAIRLYQVIIA